MSNALPHEVREIARVLEADPALLRAAEALPESGETAAPRDGAALVREVEDLLMRYVVLPPHTACLSRFGSWSHFVSIPSMQCLIS